jgi:hypothetical protein
MLLLIVRWALKTYCPWWYFVYVVFLQMAVAAVYGTYAAVICLLFLFNFLRDGYRDPDSIPAALRSGFRVPYHARRLRAWEVLYFAIQLFNIAHKFGYTRVVYEIVARWGFPTLRAGQAGEATNDHPLPQAAGK